MKRMRSLLYSGLLAMSLGFGMSSCANLNRFLMGSNEINSPKKIVRIETSYKDEDDRKFMMDRIKTQLSDNNFGTAMEDCERYHKKYGVDGDLEESVVRIFARMKDDSYPESIEFYEKLRGGGIEPMKSLEKYLGREYTNIEETNERIPLRRQYR